MAVEETAIDHRGMNRLLGKVSNFPELDAIITAIRERTTYVDLPNGNRCRIKIMADGNCFGVDYKGHRYVEQNQKKSSPEAERARDGAHIVWVIQTHNQQNQPLSPHLWVGKVEDGIVRMK